MRRQRRVTQAEILRRRNRRRALGLLAVLAGTGAGGHCIGEPAVKVTAFRVENFDRSTPADTGIYTEDEIVAALGIEKNSNLFGFSAEEKTRQLQTQFRILTRCRWISSCPAPWCSRCVRPLSDSPACIRGDGSS